MKSRNFLVTVQFTDGTTQDYILLEPVEIGTTYKGGKVISCNQLKRV